MVKNTIPEIVKPESYLTNRPRRASLETKLWLAALAFIKVVLDFNKESRYTFLEIVWQWGKQGCQQIINDAFNERFDSYGYAANLILQKQRHNAIQPLTTFSTKLQQYETDIRKGDFNNKDYLEIYAKS